MPAPVASGGPTSEGMPQPAADADRLKPYGMDFFAALPLISRWRPMCPSRPAIAWGNTINPHPLLGAAVAGTHETEVGEDGMVVVPGTVMSAHGITRAKSSGSAWAAPARAAKERQLFGRSIETRTISACHRAARRPGRYTVKAESNLFNDGCRRPLPRNAAQGGAAPAQQAGRRGRSLPVPQLGTLNAEVMLEDRCGLLPHRGARAVGERWSAHDLRGDARGPGC